MKAPALTGFRDRFKGQLIDPDHPEYDQASVVWNAMPDRHPALVARCAGEEDVVAAVRFAREHDLVVAVRGGGHSVAGFSTCDGGMVIDLSRMRVVTEYLIIWSRRTMAAIKPFTTVGAYVNDAIESDVASVRAIYGGEKYDKLVTLKRKYDPDNFFRMNQNIRP